MLLNFIVTNLNSIRRRTSSGEYRCISALQQINIKSNFLVRAILKIPVKIKPFTNSYHVLGSIGVEVRIISNLSTRTQRSYEAHEE